MNKKKGLEKKNKKSGKEKRAYIAWEDDDRSFSCSSREDEEANMCLMVGHQSETSSVSSSISMNYENYSTWLQAFRDTHEEAKHISFVKQSIKRFNQLEKRIAIY